MSTRWEDIWYRDRKYEFFTNISGFVRRRIAESYPNEIFPGRLFLGDYHHASDAHVIETLGITHIVNISDSC